MLQYYSFKAKKFVSSLSDEILVLFHFQQGIFIDDDPPIFCVCERCGASQSCCPVNNDTHFAYQAGTSKVVRDTDGQPIFECNKKCGEFAGLLEQTLIWVK